MRLCAWRSSPCWRAPWGRARARVAVAGRLLRAPAVPAAPGRPAARAIAYGIFGPSAAVEGWVFGPCGRVWAAETASFNALGRRESNAIALGPQQLGDIG